jgi:hypothetical protein
MFLRVYWTFKTRLGHRLTAGLRWNLLTPRRDQIKGDPLELSQRRRQTMRAA